MLEELSRFSSHRGLPRAKAFIEVMDDGCGNIFEATVLWVIKSLHSGHAITQFPVAIEDHTYFGGIVLPDLKVIIKPDGHKKFGDTEQEIRENTDKWLARQYDLTNTGWRVTRARWYDTKGLATFRTNVAA